MSKFPLPFVQGLPLGDPAPTRTQTTRAVKQSVYIPERFARQVSGHLLSNIGEVPGSPLILGVHGAPGTGKTFQIETLLREMNVELFAISGGQLESENAGEPASLIRETYCNASDVLKTRAPACLVFNDIDTGGGEWEGNTGTVNHQTVLGELMHLVDFPRQVGGQITRRVPIIMTGNDFTKLYEPLRRPGRMRLFEWIPNAQERVGVVGAIFPERGTEVVEALAGEFDALPLSFYSDLRSALVDRVLHQKYPNLASQTEAIHDLLSKKQVLEVSAESLEDEDVLLTARQLAATFSISTHLGR